jgi:hypothetical protein
LLRTFGELGKRRTECHAWKRRGNRTSDAANAVRSAHLRVEGFKLRWPAELEQEDHRFAGGARLAPGSQGAGAEKVRQAQAAQTERADAQELAAGMTGTSIEDRKHGRLLQS